MGVIHFTPGIVFYPTEHAGLKFGKEAESYKSYKSYSCQISHTHARTLYTETESQLEEDTGTPAQLPKLIPSRENGAFSRSRPYMLPGNQDWNNQSIQKKITAAQIETFNGFFSNLYHKTNILLVPTMKNCVKRPGLNVGRMQAIEAGREINVKESTVDVWLKHMKSSGLIESTGRGTYRLINREGIH